MEDFAAGFQETVDQHSSAADWIMQYRDAMPAVEQGCVTADYLVILSAVANRHDLGRGAQYPAHG